MKRRVWVTINGSSIGGTVVLTLFSVITPVSGVAAFISTLFIAVSTYKLLFGSASNTEKW